MLKDRFTLLLIISLVWTFICLCQQIINVESSLCIVVGIVLIYTLYMNIFFKHKRRKNKKNPPTLDTSFKPFVSILIPSHNEDTVIGKTIENISQIDYPNYEIIVIDDRSKDNTANVIKSIAQKYPDKIKAIIRDKDAFPGKSAVLNEAAEVAKGDIICVFDADARVKPDFLTSIMPHMASPEVGATQARKVICNKDYNLLTRCQNNEYSLDVHFQLSRDSIKGAVELRGNGQLVKREALNDVGGWTLDTITDDLDLSTKLHLKGWDIRFCQEVEVYEEGILNFMPLLRQRRRWVEGSIRRYLDYFFDILFSKEISLRASFDMAAYVFEFVLPVWLISDWAIQGCEYLKGHENHIFTSTALIVGVSIFFVIGLMYSLRRYDKLSIWQCFKQSIETGIYMMLIWTPIVTFIVLKILFLQRTMDWGKTAHGVLEEQEALSI